MGHDHSHDVHTIADPKNLKDAEKMWGSFLVWSRNGCVAVAIVTAFVIWLLV